MEKVFVLIKKLSAYKNVIENRAPTQNNSNPPLSLFVTTIDVKSLLETIGKTGKYMARLMVAKFKKIYLHIVSENK